MNKITALILAAGNSTRFWPLSGKYILNFLGKPLPYYQISQLQRFGFTDVVIVSNQRNFNFFSNIKSEFPKINLIVVNQLEEKGMAGAILSAGRYISGKPLLILNQSDVFEDLIFSDFEKILGTNPSGILAGTETDSYFPGGYLILSGNTVTGVVEKPEPDNTPSNTVKFVFDYFKNGNGILETVEKLKIQSDDRYERALDKMVKDEVFRFMLYRGFWGHLKYPWHVLNMLSYYLDKVEPKIMKNTYIDKTAIIKGRVFIEEGVKIFENTKISGPAYIGRGSIIGNNSIVRESVIGENCVIGYNTEVARSYIGNNCWFHTNYIGDSVLSDNVSLGAGTVFANYKLRENEIISEIKGKRVGTGKIKLGAIIGENVRIGVNSSIMPGIKIGRNSIIGPGVILDQDLPDDTSCTAKTVNLFRKNSYRISSENIRTNERNKLRF